MPATSPKAIRHRRDHERARMVWYRKNYPEKATASIRACYWRKRLRKLTNDLLVARQNLLHWEARVNAMRWRHE